MRHHAVLSVRNQTSTPLLAYLAFRSIFFPHESAGRGVSSLFSHKVHSFFGKSGDSPEWGPIFVFPPSIQFGDD